MRETNAFDKDSGYANKDGSDLNLKNRVRTRAGARARKVNSSSCLCIIRQSRKDILVDPLSLICYHFPKMSDEIDWEKQWATYAPGFKDGKAHIQLPTQNILELLPGPGFGDFSHPTTRLMVDLMSCFVEKETVFDIGCGSGILSLAAAKMGANKVFACDIDVAAEEHTRENALLNQVDVTMGVPPFCKPVVLMNMIFVDQRSAWQEHRPSFKLLITSGILTTEKKDYLTYAYAQGWQLLHLASLQGWLGFAFMETE